MDEKQQHTRGRQADKQTLSTHRHFTKRAYGDFHRSETAAPNDDRRLARSKIGSLWLGYLVIRAHMYKGVG